MNDSLIREISSKWAYYRNEDIENNPKFPDSLYDVLIKRECDRAKRFLEWLYRENYEIIKLNNA